MNIQERSKKIIGQENLNKIKNTTVMLVGLGGVGGASFEMLVRSGIENIIVVDFDFFEESNLNRQVLSLNNNISTLKVETAKKRAIDINKNCNVKIFNNKLNKEFLDNFKIDVNYIIDAIDDVEAKVNLIKYAIKNNIKIISSCGTGNRLNPELLKISNIWKTEYDPLAKSLRHSLRKENINYKLPVVYSKEIPIKKTKGSVGSMCMVPNTAGILLASWCINDIIKSVNF